MIAPLDSLKARGFKIVVVGENETNLDLRGLDLSSRFVVALPKANRLEQVHSRSVALGENISSAAVAVRSFSRGFCVVCENRKTTIIEWDRVNELEPGTPMVN